MIAGASRLKGIFRVRFTSFGSRLQWVYGVQLEDQPFYRVWYSIHGLYCGVVTLPLKNLGVHRQVLMVGSWSLEYGICLAMCL